MKNRNAILSSLCAVAMMMMSCQGAATQKAASPAGSDAILINQVGYLPQAPKVALIRNNAEGFRVIDSESGSIIFEGKTGSPAYWAFSGDTARTADFSAVTAPGRYRITTTGPEASSYEFTIAPSAYRELSMAVMKAFHFNRCSFEITPEYGGVWARAAGHPDTAVRVHSPAASSSRPAGTVISSPGGWYDAGDYNKYIVNSSITVYTLLLTYQLFPEYCSELNLNIPESGNDIPDVVDEILYNLRWMLTMQDPADGGVYHKLTGKTFDSFEMPAMDTMPRYVVQKSTAATLDFAAVMAMASRLFDGSSNTELKTLAAQCREAAAEAMAWAEKNPDIIFKNPADVSTGEYGDRYLADEWFWAKSEMALTEDKASLISSDDITQIKAHTPSWSGVAMLGVYSLALTDKSEFTALKETATEVLRQNAEKLQEKHLSSAYKVSIDSFAWGSNSDVANQAMLKIIADKVTGESRYDGAAQADLDYILGRNATGYCFVTGAGSKPPVNIHHRPSGSDGIEQPVPGFLAGGPNTSVMTDCNPTVERSSFPAKSYADVLCSYSTNEIAINWNAPMFFITVALDKR